MRPLKTCRGRCYVEAVVHGVVWLVLGLCGLVCPGQGMAQWSSDPSQNLQVLRDCINPRVVSDGRGGVIIVAESFTVRPKLYAQRVDAEGNVVWDPSLQGIRVSTAGHEQRSALVASDGRGGVYVAFVAAYVVGRYPEPPEDKYESRVMVQRVSSRGIPLFGPEGLAVYDYPLTGEEGGQGVRCVLSDGDHGIWLVWVSDEHGPAGSDYYVTRVRPDGKLAWDHFVALGEHSYIPEEDLFAYPDGEGGLLVLIVKGHESEPDRLVRISGSGEILSDKRIDTGLGYAFRLFAPWRGSCALFWWDWNPLGRLDTVRYQKIDREGRKLWGPTGGVLDSAGWAGRWPTTGALADSSGGAYVAYRTSDGSRLARVSASGSVRFNLAVGHFNGVGFLNNPCMVPTLGNGVIYSFYKPGEGLYAAAVDSSGGPLWPPVLYTTRECVTDFDGVVSDSSGGAIFVWYEIVPERGIWAQQVSAGGELGVPSSVEVGGRLAAVPEELELSPPRPNPSRRVVVLSYRLRRDQRVRLRIYDVTGKEVITLLDGKQRRGSHVLRWDTRDASGVPVGAGVYLCELSSGFGRRVAKVLVVR